MKEKKKLKKTNTRIFRINLISKLLEFELPVKNYENNWKILPK
jgi:hypothetical protein